MKDYMNPMSKDWMKNQIDIYEAIKKLDDNGYLDPEEKYRFDQELLNSCILGMVKIYNIKKDGEDNVN